MGESRSDFQAWWKTWESLLLAFRVFHHASFPRPLRLWLAATLPRRRLVWRKQV